MSTQVTKSKREKAVGESGPRAHQRKRRKRGAGELAPGQRDADAGSEVDAGPTRGFLERELTEGSPAANEDVQR